MGILGRLQRRLQYPDEGPVSDNGEVDYTLPSNVAELRDAVVGHKIVSAEQSVTEKHEYGVGRSKLVVTLDDGKQVELVDTYDCCAMTELQAFLLHPERVKHVITGVGTTRFYKTWHIYADAGDVLSLTVDWSEGNPFYYGYGFDIKVIDKVE
jgi:hypothetical protein